MGMQEWVAKMEDAKHKNQTLSKMDSLVTTIFNGLFSLQSNISQNTKKLESSLKENTDKLVISLDKSSKSSTLLARSGFAVSLVGLVASIVFGVIPFRDKILEALKIIFN